MNRAQRRILHVWIAVAGLLVLFPHYVYIREASKLNVGFGFLLTGPFSSGGRWSLSDHAVIDVALLAIMEVVSAAIAGALFFAAKSRTPE